MLENSLGIKIIAKTTRATISVAEIPKRIGIIITLIDPLIISLTGTIVSLPKWNYIISLLIGFILLIALIYSFYEIIGRIIKRKH